MCDVVFYTQLVQQRCPFDQRLLLLLWLLLWKHLPLLGSAVLVLP